MSPFLGFGFGGFSWGVPPTPTIGGAPQGTGRGMFAKLFDWKSPVRSDVVLRLSQNGTDARCGRSCTLHRMRTSLLRGRSVHVCYVRPAFSLSSHKAAGSSVVLTRLLVRRPLLQGPYISTKLFADAVGNYTNKTVRFRVDFDPHYNALSTPNTPLLSDPSSSSGSAWSPLGTPVMNSGRSSIGIERSPVLSAGPSTCHSPNTSHHMRHPSTSTGNSRTSGSSTSAYSRSSVSGASVAGIVCTVSFVQEKGAYSTLRIVYAKVKDGWK